MWVQMRVKNTWNILVQSPNLSTVTKQIWRACEIILYFKGVCCDFLSSWLRSHSDLGGSAICSRVLAGNSVSASPEHVPHIEVKKPPKLVTFLFQTTFLISKGLNVIVVALKILNTAFISSNLNFQRSCCRVFLTLTFVGVLGCNISPIPVPPVPPAWNMTNKQLCHLRTIELDSNQLSLNHLISSQPKEPTWGYSRINPPKFVWQGHRVLSKSWFCQPILYSRAVKLILRLACSTLKSRN